MANEITEQEEVKCSFCGKPQSQVKKIVAGNGVYICNECIDLSKKIIDDELKADSIKETKDTNIQWHPAFVSVMQLEFKKDRGKLLFEKEHNLNTKPLQIDLLVIRKADDITVSIIRDGKLRKLGHNDDVIRKAIMEQYLLSDEEITKYL